MVADLLLAAARCILDLLGIDSRPKRRKADRRLSCFQRLVSVPGDEAETQFPSSSREIKWAPS
jgi:hypothetical protein